MHPTEQLSAIIPALNDLVDTVDPAHIEGPTACDNFSLRDVLNHMIVLGGSFAYWFRGEEAPELTAPPADGTVPAAQFRAAMDDLLASVKSPGAMERVISAPVGEMPGETFARLVAFDGLVHGWDIASAAGLSYELPADVVAEVDAFAHAALAPEMRDGDTFKEATTPPADATAVERIVAFSGRTVR